MSNTEWKWGYIRPDGEFAIAPRFDGASDFHEGLASVKNDWARGYIDHKGDFVISPVFETAGDFHDGVAFVKIDGETRCIDNNGKFLDTEPQEYASTFEVGYNPPFEFHDGLIRFIENQKFGYKDENGNVVIKPQFFEATDFSEGLACVKKGKTGLWSYVNTAGKTVIPALFKQAKPFNEGLAAILTTVDKIVKP